MSLRKTMLSFCAVLSLVGAMSMRSAFADSAPVKSPAATQAPLPQDRTDAQAANPASPNCYPDVNHCATYASGDLSKHSPLQQQPSAQPKKQPQ